MIYEVLLLIGLIGLIAQSLLGLGHGAASGHHGGVAHGHGAAGAHGHASSTNHSHSHSSARTPSGGSGRMAAAFFLTFLSPMTIFSLCLGAGAAGQLARALRESPPVVVIAAILGGIFFYGAIVRPIASFVFRFASKPAETLSGAVATEAVATSRFDSRGRGVVRLSVDGQITRVLANIEKEELSVASMIAPGDRLLVTGIDKKKNACTVTRL